MRSVMNEVIFQVLVSDEETLLITLIIRQNDYVTFFQLSYEKYLFLTQIYGNKLIIFYCSNPLISGNFLLLNKYNIGTLYVKTINFCKIICLPIYFDKYGKYINPR